MFASKDRRAPDGRGVAPSRGTGVARPPSRAATPNPLWQQLAVPGAPPMIQRQPATYEAPAAAAGDATPADYAQPAMGGPPDLGHLAGLPVEPRSATGLVDVPICEVYQRKAPYTPIARLARGAVVPVKGLMRPSDGEPVYVVEYYGRMLGTDQSEKVAGLMRLFDLAVSAGPAPERPEADWRTVIPERGTKLDPVKDAEQIEARDRAVATIVANRAGIEARPFKKVAAKPNVHTEGRYYRTSDDTAAQAKTYDTWLTSAVPALATGPDDPRLEAFRDTFAAEGNPSDVMTYDVTNITWGVGFSGHGGKGGVGLTEQLMVRLFNQAPAAREAFWNAGVSVTPETLLVVVDAGKKVQLIGALAERHIREQEDLLSLMVNVSQGVFQGPDRNAVDPYLRQRVLDAQFETFINSTLRGLDLAAFPNPIVRRLAVHAVHAGLSAKRLEGVADSATAVAIIRQMLKEQGKEHLLGNVVNNLGAGTF